MARITGGRFRGRTLIMPPHLRATEAKVRQALFNILGPSIEGARVLDGFAGSGALGLEALSRGAVFVAFIESDTEAVMSIRDNLAQLEDEVSRSAWRLVHLDVERALRQLATVESPFDVMVFDPPYRNAEEAKLALNTVEACAMLAPDGVVALEHDHRTVLPVTCGSLRQWKQHRYGDTVLSLYRPHQPTEG